MNMSAKFTGFIEMLGGNPLYKEENIAKLVSILEKYPRIMPSVASSHDFDKEPFNFDKVWLHAQEGHIMSSVHIERKKRPKGYGFIGTGFKPKFNFVYHEYKYDNGHCYFPTADATCMIDLYEVGEDLVDIFHPQFFDSGHAYSADDRNGRSNGMYSCWVQKLHGLSWRTVFGPHYIKHLGRDFLLNIPNVIITELDWGGIRIDLAEKPWELSYDELYEIWKPAYDYLSTSEYYATEEIDKDGNVQLIASPKLSELDYSVPITEAEKEQLFAHWQGIVDQRHQAKADAKKAKRDAIKTSRKSKDPLSDNLFNQLMDSASSTEMVTDIVVDNIDLKGMRLPDLYLECAQFTHNFMQRAVLADSCFMDCDFANNFMSEAISQRIKMMDSRVHECDFEKAELYETQLTTNTFTGCNFQGADLRNSEIMGNTFVNCDFTKAKLNGSDFQSSSFENCNFTKTAMGKADMSQAIFINCTLDKKYAKYAKQTGHEE